MSERKNLFSRLTSAIFSSEIARQVHALFTETDNTFFVGARKYGDSIRDRFPYDREEILEESLEAWRLNPLARRIVGLTSQYVVGGGISITCKHAPTARFIEEFWHNRLNRMAVRVYELCDELTRTGNLFLLITTDPAGMSYVRAIPATDIDQIHSRPNDIEQPVEFISKADPETLEIHTWPAYSEDLPSLQGGAGGRYDGPVMLHYTINRPTGAQWGESDLAPLLKWLSRYSSWLDDRARLNRFRTAFLYIVKAKFASEAERLARQAVLSASPPSPGSIMVTSDMEEWEVISPKLESQEAGEDGLAMKKMIAAGAALPLHFLAEPESATRTTAEAAGGPTYRHFEQRQDVFTWMIADLLRVVVARRYKRDRHISKNAKIQVKGADISARDNLSLSMAASNITNALTLMFDRGMIDEAEYLRLVYRFAGEFFDIENLKRGNKMIPPEGGTIGKQPSPKEAVPDPKDAPPDATDDGASTSPKGESGGKANKPGYTRAKGKDIDPETGEPKDSQAGGL